MNIRNMSLTLNTEELLEVIEADQERMAHFTLGEGAVGSMIPTSVIIILFAIIRIIQVFQQRRNRQHEDTIKLEIIEEGHQLTE